MKTKHCDTCRSLNPMQNMCAVLKSAVDPTKHYCPYHSANLKTCILCGQQIQEAIITKGANDEWMIICNDCRVALTSCRFCQNINKCDFETNSSSLPKMVQKQIRQGPMTQIVTVKNIDRIAITCKNGCDCFSEEFGCMREFNYCERMKHVHETE